MNSIAQIESHFNANQKELFESPYCEYDRMVIRNGIRFYTTQCISIPAPVTLKYFQYYKLFYHSASYIVEEIQAGIIEKDGIAFKVKYHKSLTRGKILWNQQHNPFAQYRLSFRAPKSEYNIDPIVIISECEN